MAAFSKILTMLRANVRELGDSIIDRNGNTIYEQEIIEAKAHVAKAKIDLTAVMAKEMQAAREIERLRGEVFRFENLAIEALQKNAESLAEEVAAKVADTENTLMQQQQSHAEYAGHVQRLKDLIRTAEAALREHERQLAMAKTTESVYRATNTISQSMGSSGSKLLSAKESMERIKQRHQDMADRMQAGQILEGEFSNSTLEKKLAAAGIGGSAHAGASVMARLKDRIKPTPQLTDASAPSKDA
jgi:phage shock protein A